MASHDGPQPRRLPVFEPVDRSYISEPLAERGQSLYKWNGSECTEGTPILCEELGYEGKAAMLKKGQELIFNFDHCPTDSIKIEIRLLPNHPMNSGQLRFSISLDKKESSVISYETKGRSEEWKENVLRNQAIRQVTFPVKEKKKHLLAIKALDEGIVLDQIEVYTL